MHKLTEYELELVRVIVTHYPVDDELMPFAVEMLMSGVTPAPSFRMGRRFHNFTRDRAGTPAGILARIYKFGEASGVSEILTQQLQKLHHEHPHLNRLKPKPPLGDQ